MDEIKKIYMSEQQWWIHEPFRQETNYHLFISSNVFSSLNTPWGVCQVRYGSSNVKWMFCHSSVFEINCILIYRWEYCNNYTIKMSQETKWLEKEVGQKQTSNSMNRYWQW